MYFVEGFRFFIISKKKLQQCCNLNYFENKKEDILALLIENNYSSSRPLFTFYK